MLEVYNYLIESYRPNRDFEYRPAKRSELKKVYDSIVSMNKKSPLYKISLSKESQQYAIGVKESALALKAKIAEMSDPANAAFHSKAVSVSNDKVLSASLLKEDTGSLPQNISITVNTLASQQYNKGRELYHPSKGLERGEYNFSADVMGETYQLRFIQKDRIENIDTLQNMAQYLNNSVPGITVTVEKGEKPDYGRLDITSDRTGKVGPRSFSFDDDEIFREGVVDFFGLNRMEKAPSNADFELNGIKKQTSTNTFSIENTIQVTLNDTSTEPVGINIVPDKNPIMKSVDSFLRTFNGLLGLAKSRTEELPEHFGPSKLINEIKKLEENYQEELEANGFSASEYGMLSLDDALAVQSCEDGGMESLFTRENGFIARILDKTEAITINPLEYLDKKVVTYPNSAKTAFANPYVTSMYSGLLFNSYC